MALSPEEQKERRRAYHRTPEARARRKELDAQKRLDPNWRAKRAAATAAYRATARSKELKKAWNLRKKHGVSLVEFEAMKAAQSGKCACCGDPLSGRFAHIDHDHVTGERRGVVCHHCNTAIGLIKDSPLRAEKLAAYLRRHAPKLRLSG